MNQPLAECFVCRKHRGEILIPGGAIYKDDLVYAGHAAIPEGQSKTYLGCLFVEPKRHAAGLADLTDTEARALGLLVTRLSRALKTSEKAEYLFICVGRSRPARAYLGNATLSWYATGVLGNARRRVARSTKRRRTRNCGTV